MSCPAKSILRRLEYPRTKHFSLGDSYWNFVDGLTIVPRNGLLRTGSFGVGELLITDPGIELSHLVVEVYEGDCCQTLKLSALPTAARASVATW